MKTTSLALLSTLFATVAGAQEFPGIRTGNYTGVGGAFTNPANVADSRHSWSVNLLGFHAAVGNNNASFKLDDLKGGFDSDDFKDKLTGSGAGLTTAQINTTIYGPSFMISGKKSGVAFTTRARVMLNAKEIDGNLAERLTTDESDNTSFTIDASAANQRVNVNAWTEFGASYGRTLMEQGEHFLKGGVTLKYLAGAANAYIGIGNLTGQVIYDPITDNSYLANSTGRMQVGFGGVNIDDFELSDLTSFKSTGVGGDIGFVYEYRPAALNDYNPASNKYKLRVGVSLLDLGSINYKRDVSRSGAYDIGITGPERLNLDELKNEDIDDIKGFFDARPNYFSPVAGMSAGNYKVSLPTSLNLDVDYRVNKNVYINLAGMFAMSNADSKIYNAFAYNSVTLTPRIETGNMGLYVPIQYNELTNFNAGVAVRLGPLFLGSGSILSVLTGSSKQADAFFGIRFGGLRKEKAKKSESSGSVNEIGI